MKHNRDPRPYHDIGEEKMAKVGRKPRDRGVGRFSANLAAMLARTGRSQGELGEAIGSHQAVVSRWTREEAVPTAGQLRAVAEVFGVSMDALVNLDLSAWTDRDLARRAAVDELVAMLGLDEAYRRLVLTPPAAAPAPSGGVPAPGHHTVGRSRRLKELREVPGGEDPVHRGPGRGRGRKEPNSEPRG